MANWWEEKDEFGYTYADKNRPGYMGQAPVKPSPASRFGGDYNPTPDETPPHIQEEGLSEEALEYVKLREPGGYEDPAGGDVFDNITPDEKPYIEEVSEEAEETKEFPTVPETLGEPDILKEVDDGGEGKIKSLFQKALGAKGKQRANSYANVYEALQSYQGKDTAFLRGLRNKFSKKASITRNKTHLGDYVDFLNRGRSWVARRQPAPSAPVRTPAPTPQPQTFSQVDEFESEIGQRGQRAKSIFEAETKDGHSLDFDFDQPADTDNLSEDYSITDLSSVKDRETGTVSQLSDAMSFSSSNIIDSDPNKGNLRDGYYIPGGAARPKLNVLGIPFVVSENHLAEGRGHGPKYGNYSGWLKKIYPNGNGFAIVKNDLGEDQLVKLQDGKKWNLGLDMYTAPGTPRKYKGKIVSFSPGTVVQIDDKLTAADKDELRRAGLSGEELRKREYPSMWGRRTIIRSNEIKNFEGKKHKIYFQYGHGAETAFNHLKVGDSVKLGDVLGDMGETNQNGVRRKNPSTGRYIRGYGVPKHIDVHAFILVRDKDGKSKKVFLSPTEWLPKGTEGEDRADRARRLRQHRGESEAGHAAQMYEKEMGDTFASEQLVADVDVDQIPGKPPVTRQPQNVPTEITGSSEETETMASDQIPSETAGVTASESLQVDDVVTPPAGQGVLPSKDPNVVQEMSYEQKDAIARDLKNNPEKIEDMGEFELTEAVKKLPKVIQTGGVRFDPYEELRTTLLTKLGDVRRTQTPEAVGIRETRGLMATDEVPTVDPVPSEGAKSFVERSRELLQQEMDRYRSKEFEMSKIDPKRFWSNATTGQKIMGAIAMMLGAVGGAMTGKPNAAANMIQKMIDADIDAQKDSNENKKIMKNEAYRRVLMQINALGRAEDNEFKKAQYDLLKEQLGLKKAKHAYEVQKDVSGKTAAGAAFAQGGVPIKTWNVIRRLHPKLAKELEGKAVVIGGRVQFAVNEKQAQSLNATIKDMRLAGKSISRLGELSDDINWGEQAFKFWNAGKIEEARAHARGLIGVMRESVVGGGVMTEQDRKLIESLIPNPDKFFRLSATNRARLKFLFNKANDNVTGALKQAGLFIPTQNNIKINKSNIKRQLAAARLPATKDNIIKAIKVLKKNNVWKAQSALKYVLQG